MLETKFFLWDSHIPSLMVCECMCVCVWPLISLSSHTYSQGGRGTLDCKLHWYLEFENRVILYVGLKSFGTLIGLFESKSVETFQPIIYSTERVMFL